LLDAALGMAEFVLSHFIVLLKSDLDFQQAPASLLNKSSYLAAALGFAKFIILITMDYVILFVVLK